VTEHVFPSIKILTTNGTGNRVDLIRTEEDLERFLEELSRHDMLEYIRQQRPDTKWVVHLLTNVTFYVNKGAVISCKVKLYLS
jgi:hypothetical protein